MISREEIDAIKARVEAATPGPWALDSEVYDEPDETVEGYDPYRGARVYATPEDGSRAYVAKMAGMPPYFGPCRADAAFIAHSRTDIPKLLDEIARLQAERDCLAAATDQALFNLEESHVEPAALILENARKQLGMPVWTEATDGN